MAIMKVRSHKGAIAEFRRRLRLRGLSIDSELAHRWLAEGPSNISSPVLNSVVDSRNETLSHRVEFEKAWQDEHPGRQPFPPTFAERVRDLCREMEDRAYAAEPLPVDQEIRKLREMVEAELRDDLWIPGGGA